MKKQTKFNLKKILGRRKGNKKRLRPERNIFPHYERILGTELGFGLAISKKNIPSDSITWVIPDFEGQSGGHINIFRMIKMLKTRGFPHQHVVITKPHRWLSAKLAKAAMDKTFFNPDVSVSLGVETIPPSQYLFATSWQTAYWVSKYRDAVHKCYFIQDFEPYFYASGDEYFLAENTYKLGLTGITAGNWLAEKLTRDYGMSCHAYSFSCEKHLYGRRERHLNQNKNIFFYARPVTPRRCFDIGLLALTKVCEQMTNVEVFFAGWNIDNYKIPFHYRSNGVLPLGLLANLYSQCDVALILSGSNLSLLPMEVAACGCPLVLNDAPYANWLFDDTEVVYSNMDPDQLASSMIDILNDPVSSAQMADRAMKKAHDSDWGREGDGVSAFLKKL